jgi:thioredoxin-like negative regulator of GroEL
MHITVISPITAQNLENGMHSGNWIILYYADWCGHCKQFKPEWENLKSMVPSHINTAEIESENIQHMKSNPQIQGYPTMKLYSNNKDIGDYNGERSGNAILAHLKKSMKATMKLSKSKINMPTYTFKLTSSKHKHKRGVHKSQLATQGIMNELVMESKRIKELLKKTKVLNPARMATPSQAVKYLQGSLRRSMKKTRRGVRKSRSWKH